MGQVSFDLYLDESGKFKTAGEHTLIGGMLIPNEKNPSIHEMRNWRADIRATLLREGLVDDQTLAAGDEWHEFYQKIKYLFDKLNHDKKLILEALNSDDKLKDDKLKLEAFNREKRYTFDHCSENIDPLDEKAVAGRWETQGRILKEYLAKINALGGIPVIFDNPNGIYHIDINTTYMAVFASGIVRLYHDLMEQYPGNEIILNIHAAQRKNMTKAIQKDEYRVSPTAGEEETLERKLYLNRIRSCVLLNGGSDLLELNGFQKSIDSFEILEDFVENKKKRPHPATVICDYICNCYYSDTPKRNYRAIYESAKLCTILTFGKMPDLSDAAIERMAQEHDWFPFLKILISRNFPEKDTAEFFDRMNADRRATPMAYVNSLVSYLYPYIENRENMAEMEERLRLIIDKCDRFERGAYLNLKANILIYIHALQTHMGKDVSNVKQEFVSCIREIRDIGQRDALVTLFCNRQIVTETDCFRYEKGEEWFEAIRSHEEEAIKNSNELLAWLSMLSENEITGCQSSQYGKALGSYIQLLTKELRVLTGEQQAEKQKAAIEAVTLSFEHFSDKRDLNRAHQNACDLYTELNQFEPAMDHLFRSVSEEEIHGFLDQAKAVIRFAGNYGEKNLFVYLHFVYMMHRCFRVGCTYGDQMLDLILEQSVNEERINHLIGDPHPQAVILWHLAGSLAYRNGLGKKAESLFSDAIEGLSNCGELFQTISMAVQAEMIALGLENKLKKASADWVKYGQQYLEITYPAYAKVACYNPFTNVIESVTTDSPASFYRMADCVVY